MMMLASQNSWFRFRDFARTPSLGRSVAAMLVVAFAALILVAPATYGVAVTATSIAPVPLPASLPLLLGAAGVFGLLRWRRHRAT